MTLDRIKQRLEQAESHADNVVDALAMFIGFCNTSEGAVVERAKASVETLESWYREDVPALLAIAEAVKRGRKDGYTLTSLRRISAALAAWEETKE